MFYHINKSEKLYLNTEKTPKNPRNSAFSCEQVIFEKSYREFYKVDADFEVQRSNQLVSSLISDDIQLVHSPGSNCQSSKFAHENKLTFLHLTSNECIND